MFCNISFVGFERKKVKMEKSIVIHVDITWFSLDYNSYSHKKSSQSLIWRRLLFCQWKSTVSIHLYNPYVLYIYIITSAISFRFCSTFISDESEYGHILCILRDKYNCIDAYNSNLLSIVVVIIEQAANEFICLFSFSTLNRKKLLIM